MTCSKPRRGRPCWNRQAAILWPVLLVFVGCESKLDRFDLAGKVTYRGEPVPAGYMVLKPVAEGGNSGPGSAADIRDGRYATPPGGGTVGGPHVVTIFGFDGHSYTMNGVVNPLGKPVFKTSIEADLPKQHGTHDFLATEASGGPRR